MLTPTGKIDIKCLICFSTKIKCSEFLEGLVFLWGRGKNPGSKWVGVQSPGNGDPRMGKKTKEMNQPVKYYQTVDPRTQLAQLKPFLSFSSSCGALQDFTPDALFKKLDFGKKPPSNRSTPHHFLGILLPCDYQHYYC